MQDNNYDYNANINYLLNNTLQDIVKANFKLQNNILNSKDFNQTMKYIEESLNCLYEKNRILENISKYIKIYLENEINTNIDKCKSLLNEITNNRDITKNNSYIKYTVPFLLSTLNCTDRDNTTIPNADIYKNNIISSSNIINSYFPNNFEIEKNHENNSIISNTDDFLKSNSYRTFYMFNSNQGDAVTEIMTLYFDVPIKINKINFNTSNCNITNLSITLEDDKKINIDNKTGFIQTYTIKKMDITLECTNYLKSQKNYNEYRTGSKNFWSYIYDLKTDENLLQDADNFYYYLFGIDSLKLEYAQINTQSCFISKEIKIGTIKENEYISLSIKNSIEEGNIEYYILDGTKTINILPENQQKIIDEKIFYKTPLRFPYDTKKEIIVKKNNVKTNMTINDAINSNDKALYTVTYTPKQNNINKLNDDKIKIKVIIRNYNSSYNTFVNDIKIKKYGGGNIWKDKI